MTAPTVIAGIDVETTGLDPVSCEVIEVAVVIKEVGDARVIYAESTLLRDVTWPENIVPDELAALHGITNARLQRFARHAPYYFLSDLAGLLKDYGVSFLVAHNATFDRSFLAKYTLRFETDFFWLCTREDITHDRMSSMRLGHLAADRGFVNPFPHAALSDVMTMLRILETADFDAVVERSRSPSMVIRAMVSYDERDKAKARRFMWEQVDPTGRRYEKCWVKRVKQMDLLAETQACQAAGFKVVELDAS